MAGQPGERKAVDVLVVGGGPAGMVLACLLSRMGLHTLVLERGEDFSREFRGEILQPRFHRAMKDVGLFDHLAGYPHEAIDRAYIHFNGKRVGALNLRRLDPRGETTWWMTQPTLLQALQDFGEAGRGFELWFDAALRELDGGTAHVERPGGAVAVEAPVIVGADGRFSTVRRLAGCEAAYEEHDLDVLWFLLERPANYAHTFGFFLTPHRNYLVLPKHPNQLQCGVVLPPGEFSEIRKQPIESMQAELRRAHPVFADFAAGLESYAQFRPLKGSTELVADWARDGLLLIGDAAHTCSPAGGIGVAIAVETACVAAAVIRQCFEDGDFSRERLSEVQRRRLGEVREVHAFQHRVGRVLVQSSPLARRLAAYGVRMATWSGLMPVLARRIVTQRHPLPDLRHWMAH